ncbi:hypothetical protein GOP47_0011278 [Adiantum capillus-veneris]|uniref:glucan endo-1,3-beta-D-glucosidase n=1 Tax=Adiantum capillus-veneris TaxID=13818 RepID=A0A9D4USV5_ADICA|nr:hypothetical protein GOP47_0011278 [Adiantum capillus-veneris]
MRASSTEPKETDIAVETEGSSLVVYANTVLSALHLQILQQAGSNHRAFCKVSFGINYGKVANNLPAPAEVVSLFQSISITKARLYDTDPLVLKTFRNTDISFLVGVANEDLASLASPEAATRWVETNILPYYPTTDITGIIIGNELFSGTDTTQLALVLPAMRNIYSVLMTLNLQRKIRVSTTHSFAVLGSSYPPSSGVFNPAIANSYMKPILQFLALTNAPFMINTYPFFAYKGSPGEVSLQYVLFEDSTGTHDANTGLVYYNMFDAQLDAVYFAMAALGYPNVSLVVAETGWPSAGDANEVGATLPNAQTYQRNLFKHLSSGQGTPLRPNASMEVYFFALFNENLKPGPTSERHYGLFKPDGRQVWTELKLFGVTLYWFWSALALLLLPPRSQAGGFRCFLAERVAAAAGHGPLWGEGPGRSVAVLHSSPAGPYFLSHGRGCRSHLLKGEESGVGIRCRRRGVCAGGSSRSPRGSLASSLYATALA